MHELCSRSSSEYEATNRVGRSSKGTASTDARSIVSLIVKPMSKLKDVAHRLVMCPPREADKRRTDRGASMDERTEMVLRLLHVPQTNRTFDSTRH